MDDPYLIGYRGDDDAWHYAEAASTEIPSTENPSHLDIDPLSSTGSPLLTGEMLGTEGRIGKISESSTSKLRG